MEDGTHVLIRHVPLGGSELLSTTGTIHIDIPNKSDGTLSKVPVLLQMPDNVAHDPKDFQVVNSMALSESNQPPNDSEVPVLPSTPLVARVNLEDFVDVITTYKCKFCRFSCAWKSGLMSHIRNTHISKLIATTDSDVVIATSDCDTMGTTSEPISSTSSSSPISAPQTTCIPTLSLPEQNDNSVMSFEESKSICVFQPEESYLQHAELQPEFIGPSQAGFANATQERQLFLCGSCHESFGSLELCKNHIVQHHQMKYEVDKASIKKKRRPKPRQKRQHYPVERDSRNGEKPQHTNSTEEVTETLSKRKVRPPRALSEDYYLLSRKRKYVRRQAAHEKTFRCEIKGCTQHFLSEENLKYHMRCHKEDEHMFQCGECSEKFEHWRGTTMHLWKDHQIDLDLYTCDKCGYRTYSSFKLENHCRIHSDERSYVCGVCKKGFKQMSQLRNHQVVHLDRKSMTEKRWFSEQRCDICNRTFSDSKCLRKHMQAVHNKLKPYICPFCGHSSARKAMLQLHLRQHTGEKPFQCDLCEYRTGDHNSLRRHKMRHSGIKPYKCPHCSYACIQAISYKTHMKNKHPGMEGLFSCNLCPYKSVSKENFINHMADHERGAIPIQAAETPMAVSEETALMPSDISSLAQLEGMLPGHNTTTQLIYSCLNALSQGGTATLPPGASASTSNGTQTITIEIPNEQNAAQSDHIYLTIQQPPSLTEAQFSILDDRNATAEGYSIAASTQDMQLALDSSQIDTPADSLDNAELIPSGDILYSTSDGGNINISTCVTNAANLSLLPTEIMSNCV